MDSTPYRYAIPDRLDPEAWIRVDGDGLPQPIEIKVRAHAGALQVIGLRIDNGEPVSSGDLRRVRLSEIADGLLATFHKIAGVLDEEIADVRSLARSSAFAALPVHGEFQGTPILDVADVEKALSAEPSGPLLGGMYADLTTRRAELQAQLDQLGEPAPRRRRKRRGPGAATPTDEDYRDFARVYLEESIENERGAIGRTAKRIGMHRTTAYRWLAACQERGLVSREEVGR